MSAFHSGILNRVFARWEVETLVAWRSFCGWTKQDPLAHPSLNGCPQWFRQLGGCKKEKQLVWLTQQDQTLIHGLGMITSGGGEVKGLVGPCSSPFLLHCGLEGSQSPSYLLSFRKGFFCWSSCTAARQLFEVKINLHFMLLCSFFLDLLCPSICS